MEKPTMEIKQLLKSLFDEEQAVSPVIGVILMVAITVILAAVIGTFVLGLGDQVQSNAPQASFTFDYTAEDSPTVEHLYATGDDSTNGGGSLTITHDGGDKIAQARLSFADDDGGNVDASNEYAGSTDVSAGTSVTITVGSDDTVRVVWSASSGDNTATLGKWTGPDA